MDSRGLEAVPLFAALSAADRRRLAQWADEVEVGAGTPLVREGDFAYEFFVIEEGVAEVTHDDEVLTELGPGDFFGEIALTATRRRTASVRAKTPMKLIVMFKREFGAMADAFPKVAEQVRQAVVERLERSS